MVDFLRVSVPSIAFDSVSPDRVRLWMHYGMQATTTEQFLVLSGVTSAFYYEMACLERLQQALSYMAKGRVDLAVNWFDLLFSSVRGALNQWSSLLEGLSCESVEGQWYQDASAHVQFFMPLPKLVVGLVMSLCAEYGLAVPERIMASLRGEEGTMQAL